MDFFLSCGDIFISFKSLLRGANCKNHFLVSERRGNFYNIKYYRVGEFGWRWMGWECARCEGCRPKRRRHPQRKNALHFQSPMHFLQSLCVPAAREENFWRRRQVKILLFLPETLFLSSLLLPSPSDEKISSQRFQPPSASLFVLTVVRAFYFTWRNTSRYKKNQLHKDKYRRTTYGCHYKVMTKKCPATPGSKRFLFPRFISSVPNENRVQVY